MAPDLKPPDLRAVLVVEDSDDDFDTVVEAAGRARVANRLVHAVDADAALLLLAAQDKDAFAFMLLDYNLPGQDGLSLLRELRRSPQLQRMPIIVFTTSVNPLDRDAFYAAGANAYHVKTVRYAACLQSLEVIFGYWLGPVLLPTPAARLQ